MTTRSRVFVALAALPALLLAGCATTVAGNPQPGTTFPPTVSSATSLPPTSSSPSSATSSRTEVPPVPPTSASTPPTTQVDTTTTTSSGPTKIGGISITDLLADLADDGVALVNSSASADELASAVADARQNGLELSVVSIGDKIDDSDAGDIADAVFAEIKGTVLVLTPTIISSRSDQLTGDQVKAANKAASAGKNDLEAVQKYTASALGADAPSSSKTTTTPPKTTTAVTKDMVNGVDVAAVASAAAKDGVYVQSGVTGVNRADLVALVKSSGTKGLKLTIFILADDVTGHLYDVADGVRNHSKTTVIGMSPSVYAISSATFSNSQLQDAVDAAAKATTYLEVATKMVNSLLAS